jgi:hypothetical protein
MFAIAPNIGGRVKFVQPLAQNTPFSFHEIFPRAPAKGARMHRCAAL